jgi:copper transport protein
VLRRRLLRTALLGSAAALLASPALLLVQAGGASLPRLLRGGYGAFWTVREVALAATLVLVGAALHRERRGTPPTVSAVALPGAVLLLTYGAATASLGHVLAEGGPLRLAVDALHICAAVVWSGSLVGFVLAGARRPSGARPGTGPVLRRFGVVGAGCLATMTLTGLLLASGGVASVDALIVSVYGRFVLAKLVATGALVLAAAVTAMLVHPELTPGPVRMLTRRWRRPSLRVALLAEAGMLVLLVALGSAVSASRPAVGTEWQPTSSVVPLRSGQVEDLVETVTVSPNRPGRNFVTVDVYDTRRPSPGPVQRVQVLATSPDGRQVPLVAQPQGDGRWLAVTDGLDTAGDWHLRVVAVRADLPDAAATYPWAVQDPGARLSRTLVSSRGLAPVVDGLVVALLAVLLAGGWAVVVRRRRRRQSGAADHAPPAPRRPRGSDADDPERVLTR